EASQKADDQVSQRCPACQAELPARAHFCSACGHRIGPQAEQLVGQSTPRPTPAPEEARPQKLAVKADQFTNTSSLKTPPAPVAVAPSTPVLSSISGQGMPPALPPSAQEAPPSQAQQEERFLPAPQIVPDDQETHPSEEPGREQGKQSAPSPKEEHG